MTRFGEAVGNRGRASVVSAPLQVAITAINLLSLDQDREKREDINKYLTGQVKRYLSDFQFITVSDDGMSYR